MAQVRRDGDAAPVRNHARTCGTEPSPSSRVDQLWYKYIHMEEMLGNIAGARQVFERWMAWEPDHHGWSAYIKFEMRVQRD